MLNEQLPDDHIQHALKRRNLKMNHSNKRFKIDQHIFQTTIECLPNELFYQIFSYLTDGELILSFHLLTKNIRFDELIRNRTSINLRSIRRLQFLENKSLINPNIVRQIYLFNDDDTPGIINLFFTLYSFPNLQNLVLDQPEQNDLIVK
jgi:hypothetical protein